MRTVSTIADVRAAVKAARDEGREIVLVPTMGALHDGHQSLVEHALERGGFVVVSIFVNPMQFGPNEDLAVYPRDPEGDAERLESVGVDLVFAPEAEEMYPTGASATTISAGHMGTMFEGRSRPGHFDGMLTVVSKLLHIVQPDTAVFGEKDAQQLFLIRRMVRDLNMPIEIVGMPIVRDHDGLALSSRNRRLSDSDRRDALAIPRALEAACGVADRGVETMIAAAQSVLQSDSGVQLDYLSIVDPATFALVPDDYHGPVQLLIAAKVGNVRLIDNALARIP